LLLLAARLRLKQARHLPRNERVAAAFGIDALDLVHYETISHYSKGSALLHAVLHEEVPFKEHSQWCHSITKPGGDCDCGAVWQAYLGGELKSMCPASQLERD
jgi:hypothetical protein